MALLITSAPEDELLSTEEAKRHLRILTGDHDTELGSLIRDVRDYAEGWTQRTLRGTVTRTKTFSDWWCGDLYLPWPPLIGVTSVTYYDADNVSQTLAAGNYHVELSTNGGGKLIWSDTASLPSLYTRPNAITVTFTTGYANLASVPPAAVRAMKLLLTELWGAGTESEIETAKKAAHRYLDRVDWTGYA